MDLSRLMPDINKYLKDSIECIEPSSDAIEGLSVPKLVSDYGSVYKKIKDLPHNGPIMFKTLSEARRSYKELKVQPNNGKKEITDSEMLDLRKVIKSLGIDEIGFATVDTNLIFSNKKILYSNAIILIMEMKEDKIKQAPSIDTSLEIYRTYHNLGVAVNKITAFLKDRGFKAEAGPALGGEVNYPLLAQKAGVGVIGKHGLLITPKYGPSVRIAAVYTEIENLPITSSTNHLWIKEFCKTCNRCVESCKADAIYRDALETSNGLKHMDYKKCARPFSDDHGCTVCVKSCSFFKGDYVKIKKAYFNRNS